MHLASGLMKLNFNFVGGFVPDGLLWVPHFYVETRMEDDFFTREFDFAETLFLAIAVLAVRAKGPRKYKFFEASSREV